MNVTFQRKLSKIWETVLLAFLDLIEIPTSFTSFIKPPVVAFVCLVVFEDYHLVSSARMSYFQAFTYSKSKSESTKEN